MSVFLYVCIDRFSLSIFNCTAEFSWIIILLLTPLQMQIKKLQLIQKVINIFNSIDLSLLDIWLELSYERKELFDHEKLLQNRVHIANTSQISNTYKFITRLSLLPYFSLNYILKHLYCLEWIVFKYQLISKFSILI